jgi:dTMP kinase
MACFIVFEGGDGSGKSTQARSLLRRMRRRGVKALRTHEPGGTPLGQYLRHLLKSGAAMTPMSELMLFEAARAQLVDTVIKPFLDQGGVVIADRFTSSTMAYQGYGRGLDRELIERLNREATGGLEPDLTVLLDLQLKRPWPERGRETEIISTVLQWISTARYVEATPLWPLRTLKAGWCWTANARLKTSAGKSGSKCSRFFNLNHSQRQ